jgi:hypothetical protein
MRYFNIGIWTGIICSISWFLFDMRILSRVSVLKELSNWLKASYRRSIVLDLAIIIGFFSIQARLLDMLNGFVAVCTTTVMVGCYNLVVVSMYKLTTPRPR